MHGILDDLRLGLRLLVSRPLFALTAIATIALGIGSNAAIFSVVNGLLLRPLPYPDADELVFPLQVNPRSGFLYYPDGRLIDAWERDARSVASVQAYGGGEATVMTTEGPRVVRGASATHGLLELLRLRPHLGRDLAPDDERPGAPPVVLLGFGFWQSTFGGDRDVVGRVLAIDDVAHTIIGVAPRDLVLPVARESERDVWRPFRRGADGLYEAAALVPVTRLRDGVTEAGTTTELANIARRAAQDGGREGQDVTVRLYRPADLLASRVKLSLYLLLGAVALVLLIGCANVANLLLARAAERESELAVRAALGASRGRLLRQLATESVLLGVAGGALGYVLAHWGLDLIVALRPDSLRELSRVRIDGRVTAFAALITLGASLAFGLVPAVRASRHALSSTLRSGSAAILGSVRGRRLGAVFIAAEVALSLVLLAGAGLLMRTFVMLQNQPVGYEPDGLVAVTIDLPRHSYRDEQRAAFFEQLRETAATLPGVRSAHLVLTVPPEYGLASGDLRIDGTPLDSDRLPRYFVANHVDPDYFDALGISLSRGRTMRPEETDVIVVSESFAQRFFADRDVLGRRIRFGNDESWWTIVGVAQDIPAHGLAMDEPVPQLHYPSAGAPFAPEVLLLATGTAPAAIRDALQAALERLDPTVPVRDVRTLSSMLQSSLDGPRFNLLLLGVLAGMAALLAAVGLYGVVSVAVGQRTREIGIRRALGETDGGVLRLALGEGLRPTLLGLGAGLVGALLLTRIMRSLLFGLSPRDPVTLIAVSLVLALVALLACWIPARRAVRVEPLMALRWER